MSKTMDSYFLKEETWEKASNRSQTYDKYSLTGWFQTKPQEHVKHKTDRTLSQKYVKKK